MQEFFNLEESRKNNGHNRPENPGNSGNNGNGQDHNNQGNNGNHGQNPNKPEPKEITIVVNTIKKTLPKQTNKLSYEEVVALAYGKYDNGSNIVYTVDYFEGPKQNEEGHLVKGSSVKVCDGMVFTVGRSDKS